MVRTERTYWTAEEDQRLVEQVQQHGTNKWVVIASSFEGKDNKSCSHRYNNYLDPLLNKSPFSPWEDSVVSQLYKEVGPRWKYIAKCLSGSQGRRSANTVKNRYQALKKYWVPMDAVEGHPAMPEAAMGSEHEDEDMHDSQTDSQPAVRPDVPGAATNTATTTSQQQQLLQLQQQPQVQMQMQPPQQLEQPQEGVETEGMSAAQGAAQPAPGNGKERQEPKGLYTCLKEGALTADGPLYHKFMVLQSRLHKTSQVITAESQHAQAWEHDKQKIHNHLDSIKSILDARVLALSATAAQEAAVAAAQEPEEEKAPEERPVLAALPATEPDPDPEAAPKAPAATVEKDPDSKSDLSNVSASSGAGKRTAEKLKRGRELDPESSELDVACILNDLANAPTDERNPQSVDASGRPVRKRSKPQSSS